jgi:hypothetical protein
MWEPPLLPNAPEQCLAERRLLCQILRENISAAKRGDQRSVYWLQSDDSGFTEIIGLLQLDPSIIELIRKSVKQERPHHRNQYSSPKVHPAPAEPVKCASAATLPARLAVPWRPLTLSPAAALLEAPEPFAAPAPIWIDGICLQTLPLPRIVRRRRNADTTTV